MALARAFQPVHARVLTTSAYAGLRGEADALASRSAEANVFALPGAVAAAARQTGATVHVATAFVDGRLTGVLPVTIRRPAWGGPRQAVAELHPYAVLSTPLLDPARPLDAWAGLLDALASLPSGPAVLRLPFLGGDGAAETALWGSAQATGRRVALLERYGRAALMPEDGPSDAFDTRRMDGPGGRTLRKERRRLAALGATLIRHSGPTVPARFESFLALEVAGWKGRAGTAIACRAVDAGFMRELVSEPGRAEIFELRAGDHPLAMGLVLRAGDEAWFHKIAYDEAWGRLSPGLHLAIGVSRLLLDDPGVRRVDSCILRGAGMLAGTWTAERKILDVLVELRPSGLAFPMTVAAERAYAAARASLKQLWHQTRPGDTHGRC